MSNQRSIILGAVLVLAIASLAFSISMNSGEEVITGRAVTTTNYYCCGLVTNLQIITSCASTQNDWKQWGSGPVDSCYTTTCDANCKSKHGASATGVVSATNKKICTCSYTVTGGATCTDTDGGKVYGVAGAVTVGASQSWDSCLSSTSLKEFYCESNVVNTETITCPSGQICSERACKSPPPTCTDTDGGVDYSVSGSCTSSTQTARPDACNGAILTEYACSSSNVCVSSTYTCLDGCSAGKCNPAPAACTDTDGGNVPTVAGTASQDPTSGTDVCINSEIVNEYYCTGANAPITNVTKACSEIGFGYACIEGACLPPLEMKVVLAKYSPIDHKTNPASASYYDNKMQLLEVTAPKNRTVLDSIGIYSLGSGDDALEVRTIKVYAADSSGNVANKTAQLVGEAIYGYATDDSLLDIPLNGYIIEDSSKPVYLLITYEMSPAATDKSTFYFLTSYLNAYSFIEKAPEFTYHCSSTLPQQILYDVNNSYESVCSTRQYCNPTAASAGKPQCCSSCLRQSKLGGVECIDCVNTHALEAEDVRSVVISSDSALPAKSALKQVEIIYIPAVTADTDLDKVNDSLDNCPVRYNADQKDADADKVGDACDYCLGSTAGVKVNASGCEIISCVTSTASKPADGEWSVCISGIKAREVSVCNSTTGIWDSKTDTEACIIIAQSECYSDSDCDDDEFCAASGNCISVSGGDGGGSGGGGITPTEEGTPAWVWILASLGGVLLLGGGGFAIWWFYGRNRATVSEAEEELEAYLRSKPNK